MIWMDVDTALSEVPVNVCPLTDDTDFKTVEEAVAYNAAGMALYWHFTTPAGATTVTAVTPTTGGDYDWAHQDHGIYTIEIPASGGASINNDTEGFGYFTGVCTGVLPWRGPTIGFRAAGLNNALVESAWSATRGLAGTALPDAAADAAGGLPISDAGGQDIDTALGRITTALPDAAPDAAGGLPISDAGGLDIDTLLGRVDATITGIPADMLGENGWAIRANTAQAGAAGTITLDASASATDDLYNGSLIWVYGGTGAGQARIITDYDGTTKVATIAPNWTTNPGADSTFRILPCTDQVLQVIGAAGAGLTEAGGDGDHLTEAGGTGDQLTDLATAAALATAQADLDTLTGTDGATLATAQGNYAPAKAGDLMGLANDAITSAKFDESTAFPLKSADTGATEVARTGADGDTLETLSDQLDGVAAGVNRYHVVGDAVEDTSGNIRWVVWCEKDGQPYEASNLTVQIVTCDGDNTITNVSGASETAADDDANHAFNGSISASLSAGVQYYILASLTADAASKVGLIPIKAPVRSS